MILTFFPYLSRSILRFCHIGTLKQIIVSARRPFSRSKWACVSSLAYSYGLRSSLGGIFGVDISATNKIAKVAEVGERELAKKDKKICSYYSTSRPLLIPIEAKTSLRDFFPPNLGHKAYLRGHRYIHDLASPNPSLTASISVCIPSVKYQSKFTWPRLLGNSVHRCCPVGSAGQAGPNTNEQMPMFKSQRFRSDTKSRYKVPMIHQTTNPDMQLHRVSELQWY